MMFSKDEANMLKNVYKLTTVNSVIITQDQRKTQTHGFRLGKNTMICIHKRFIRGGVVRGDLKVLETGNVARTGGPHLTSL